jgi:hypothetical protein
MTKQPAFRNILREMWSDLKAKRPERTMAWWADRWEVEESTVRRWMADPNGRAPHRRIGPRHRRRIFHDPIVRRWRGRGGVRLTMDSYYAMLPPSPQWAAEGPGGEGR